MSDPLNMNGPEAESRRRAAASVTLRQAGDSEAGGAVEAVPSLDPATKSLADALKITYRLLQVAMGILALLYILSGFQRVNESERGIRLQFGRVKSGELGSGFQFSWPAPFGELVKVPIGTQSQELRAEFFPRLTDAEEKTLLDRDKAGVSALSMGGSDSLDPDADGMLLTADGNIAHARWNLGYQRSDARANITAISPEHELQMVKAAASRGIVQAAANVTIDELIRKQSDVGSESGGTSKVEMLAKVAAQAALDEMGAGITITQMAMTMVIPPRRVMDKFSQVQSAASTSAQEEEKANQYRNNQMTKTAGEAAPILLQLIGRYEVELAKDQKEQAAATLALIDKALLREPIEIDGKRIVPDTFGRVSELLNEARQYRTSVTSNAKSQAGLFAAKRELFMSNPLVMVHSEWADAMRTMFTRDGVQMLWLPPDMGTYVLKINKDPEVTRNQRMQQQSKEFEAAEIERQKRLRLEQLNRTIDSSVRESAGQ